MKTCSFEDLNLNIAKHIALSLLESEFEYKSCQWNAKNVRNYILKNLERFTFSDHLVFMSLVNIVFQIGIEMWTTHTYEKLTRYTDENEMSEFRDVGELLKEQEKYQKKVVMVYFDSHFDLLEVSM